jgi:hypothetical protein
MIGEAIHAVSQKTTCSDGMWGGVGTMFGELTGVVCAAVRPMAATKACASHSDDGMAPMGEAAIDSAIAIRHPKMLTVE